MSQYETLRALYADHKRTLAASEPTGAALRAEILRLREVGVTWAEMGRELDVDRTRVQRIAYPYRLTAVRERAEAAALAAAEAAERLELAAAAAVERERAAVAHRAAEAAEVAASRHYATNGDDIHDTSW